MNIEQRGRATIDTLKTVAAALPVEAVEPRRLLDSNRNAIVQRRSVLKQQRGKLRQARANVTALKAVLDDLELAMATAQQQLRPGGPPVPYSERGHLEDKCAALAKGIEETRDGFEMAGPTGVYTSVVVGDVYAAHNMKPGESKCLRFLEERKEDYLGRVKETLSILEADITGAHKAVKLLGEAAVRERDKVAARLKAIDDTLAQDAA